MPDWRSPWREVPFAVVDVETTGLDARQDELLSVGVVPIDAGRIVAGACTYLVVRPVRPPAPANVVVHGITPGEAMQAPPLRDVVPSIVAALDGRVPVAHVAWVERAFLAPVLRRHGARFGPAVLDTDQLLRWVVWREEGLLLPPHLSLAAAAARLGLPVQRPHHALGDALTTAQVFLAVAGRLETRGPVSPGSLRNAQRRLSLARAIRPPTAGR